MPGKSICIERDTNAQHKMGWGESSGFKKKYSLSIFKI